MITATEAAALGEASRAGSAQGAAIEISELIVNYGPKRAVDGLSLRVPAGTIYGFLGPNGAGKTTTIKTLLGLRTPNGGSARVLGYDIVGESTELRARTGYVSEANSLYDHLTVSQMNDFCRSTARKWNQARVERFIQMFGLPPGAKVRQLSNGMKRQLALSLAVGNDPELLILDEPTSGLDPIARHELLNRLVVSDELDHLKQSHKVLKLVYSEAPTAQEVEALRAISGVGQVEQEGRSVRLVTRKDVEGVARQVRESFPTLRDLEIVDLNLEDLFLEYMKEGGNGR